MAKKALTPTRRVVTGDDANGKSTVAWDGPAPATHEVEPPSGRGHIDFWVWNESPAPLDGKTDDGNLHYDFPGPRKGGHLRLVESHGRAPGYDQAKDTMYVPPHPIKEIATGRRWDRGGMTSHSGGMHKTETVDYAIMLSGERTLVLDDGEVAWFPGDIVIDIGAWHQWKSHGPEGGRVAYDMIAAKFVDGPVGLVQGNDKVMQPTGVELPPGVKPARRIICLDREADKSCLVSDAPSPDVRLDPARPGYALQRMWVTDGTPCKIVYESLHLPNVIVPPADGSVMNVMTYPPDATWKGKVGANEVAAFFKSIGSPQASTYSANAPHPYMQKTRTLDFGIVTDGELTLVLDTREVVLKTGDFLIVRGNNYALSNRTNKPATIALASHDGKA